MSMVPSHGSTLDGPSSGNISDVVGLILDKGLVIDVYARVSLVGIEVLTVDARVVVASVDTYLRFAEAASRLDLEANRRPGLPDLLNGLTGGGSKARAALDAAADPAQMPIASEGRRANGHRNGETGHAKVPRRRGKVKRP
jgi:hypothetical protein